MPQYDLYRLRPGLISLLLAGLITGILAPASVAFAGKGNKSGVLGYVPTFFFDTQFGFATHKSKMVVSNDTGTGLAYGLGGWAGEDRDYGFKVNTDTSSTTFELNSSSVAVTWQDTIIRYRMWFFYLGVNFASVNMVANNAGTDQVDAGGNGMGGNAGILVPVGRSSIFYLDVVSAAMSATRNALTDEVAFGSRLDIDAGGSIDITKEAFDFLMGYRMRTYDLSVAGTSYAEAYNITYFGVRMALFF